MDKNIIDMELLKIPYRDHFMNYGSNFYRMHRDFPEQLNDEERFLLSEWGLPTRAVPFFYFDLHLSELRAVKLEEGILVLGSAFEIAGFDYLYLDRNHEVMVKLQDGTDLFVNSSLRQLMNSIYAYSTWLESLEERLVDEAEIDVGPDDTFELFYSIRECDLRAVSRGAVWHYIVNTEMNIETIMVD
ncbi:MAG: hypothetical protein EA411_02135 [Saprospirales bacterium]|nr:MAG: hypothetical protein EA411_02135 [Saprospirales bacterium]